WVDCIVADGTQARFQASELDLGYRTSRLLGTRAVVVRAAFELRTQGDPEEVRHRTAVHLAERRRKQPLTAKTAGSTFKQPTGGRSAGWYIEQSGLKETRIGGARIS